MSNYEPDLCEHGFSGDCPETHCPVCGTSDAQVLGTLCKRTWFRCNDCGIDFSKEVRP